MMTTLEKAQAWARGNALFPATFGLACCAIEMMSMVSARYDSARFGAEVFRASPRQADMLILSGRVSIKMVPVIRRIYDQMLEPKWVLSMGACSSSGGMFANYAVVQGADKFLPVDIHIPGCPPRPEALIYAILKLQRKVFGEPDLGWRERYAAYGTEEGDRRWQPGAIPVERAGTSPADGILGGDERRRPRLRGGGAGGSASRASATPATRPRTPTDRRRARTAIRPSPRSSGRARRPRCLTHRASS